MSLNLSPWTALMGLVFFVRKGLDYFVREDLRLNIPQYIGSVLEAIFIEIGRT